MTLLRDRSTLFLILASAVILALCWMAPTPAAADERPLFSWTRLGLGASAGYTWYGVNDNGGLPIAVKKEFQAGPRISYNLLGGTWDDGSEVEHPVSLTLTSDYGFDSKLISTRLGVTVVLLKEGR